MVRISDAVSSAMKISGVKQKDLMPVFHTTKQGVSTKLARNSWYGKDLVKVAEAVGADLAFVFKDGTIKKAPGAATPETRGEWLVLP